jgi:hypothetical protein
MRFQVSSRKIPSVFLKFPQSHRISSVFQKNSSVFQKNSSVFKKYFQCLPDIQIIPICLHSY